MKKLQNTTKIVLALVLATLAFSGCLPVYGIEDTANADSFLIVEVTGAPDEITLQEQAFDGLMFLDNGNEQETDSRIITVRDNKIIPGFTDDTTDEETTASETTVSETTVPETTASETTVSETDVPETTVPETTVPETTVSETTVPETTVSETTVPETDAPETTVPETTVSETTVPETDAPETTVSETTVPETDAPEVEAEPEVAKTVVNQTVYATTNVWLRSDWSDNPAKYVVLSKDASITRTATYENGWSGLAYNGKEVFVKTQYLTTTKPVAQAAPSTATNWEYSRDGLSINIEKVKTSSKTYFVAKVYTENPGVDIATMFSGSGSSYTSSFKTKEVCSTLAKKADAIFAINGDAVGFRPKTFRNNIVIRNGKLWYEGSKGIGSNLAMQSDGTLFVFNDNKYTGQQLMDMDVINTWWFDDVPLVINGEIISALRNGNDEYLQPRTAIGQVDKNNFIFIVCDGRGSNGSEGIGYKGMARLMKDLGATTAYILDGGGSSTMYFDGQVINRPCNSGGAERGLSDIIYVRK